MLEKLTPAQLRVVRMAAEGKANKAIARDLTLSPHTVKVHLSRAYQILGVSNRIQLVRIFVKEEGLPA